MQSVVRLRCTTHCNASLITKRFADNKKNARLASQRVALIDMDGVLCPCCPVTTTKIEMFVAETLNIASSKAQTVNRTLYTLYGHTLIGLQQAYKFSEPLELIDRFKRDVYGDLTLEGEWFDQQNLRNEARVNTDIINEIKSRNVVPVVFSNAPSSWCRFALRRMGYEEGTFKGIIGSDHELFKTCDRIVCFKPQYPVYENIERRLLEIFDAVQIDYIEDSFINLVPVMDTPGWTAYWYVNDLRTKAAFTSAEQQHKYRAISNLSDYARFL